MADWEPPETQVAWRAEVEWLNPNHATEADLLTLAKLAAEDLLDDYPLKSPANCYASRATRVADAVRRIGQVRSAERAGVADRRTLAKCEVVTTSGRVGRDTEAGRQERLRHRHAVVQTVLLPPAAGGLNAQGGLLDGHRPTGTDRELRRG